MEKLPNVYAQNEECTNMVSSLPQNHLEHATSAIVHNEKANHSTCTKDVVEPEEDTNFQGFNIR